LLVNTETKFQKESLAEIGVADRIIEIQNQSAIQVEELFVSTTTGGYLRHPAHRGSIWAMNAFDSIKIKVADSHKQLEGFQKLYISRESATRRKLLPIHEINDLMANLGFQRVSLEDLSFAEQVKLFSDADTVVGPHGAGLAGVSFMKPNSRLIEIHGHDYGTPAFKLLSGFRNIQYFSITGENTETNVGNRSDIYISPKILASCLENFI
jgi:capsular polysaccharide biosynthesis protein